MLIVGKYVVVGFITMFVIIPILYCRSKNIYFKNNFLIYK